MNYKIGYIIAHEFLHQLIFKSRYHLLGIKPTDDRMPAHINKPLNLNTSGTYSGINAAISKGPGNEAEEILIHHRIPIELYLRKNGEK